MNKKSLADNYFKCTKYVESLDIYNEILIDDANNFNILLNRSLVHLKLKKYNNALLDAINCIKHNTSWAKAWGRLGNTLHAQNNYKDAIKAYQKSYDLEPNPNYIKMINKLKNKNLSSLQNNLLTSLFATTLNDTELLKKLINPKFQEKVFSMQKNPINMLKDDEIMDVMAEFMAKINL